MSDGRRRALNEAKRVILDASGGGRLELGPGKTPFWNVTKLMVSTNRPGVAPIPRCFVYLDEESSRGKQGSTYDGSNDESDCDIDVHRGQTLIAVWIGGQAGDAAELSVSGWVES
ncbi:hypothetical protein QBA54_50800 [Streptomyces sp. B21-108]|uniref:hypothetical protein n=1 Tax=Streptomyces sp. B21-108 TaxID=3039419 RepID=UPI002FF1F439